MKHVWILNHYAQEPDGPGGTRHHSLARHLPKSGWRATIVAASTEHPSGRQRLGSGERSRLDQFDDVPFLWLHAPEYSGDGTDRIRNMLAYTRRVLQRRSLEMLEPPDVIIGSSVHPFTAWAGSRLARRHGVPFIFEVRDLWPQALIDMGRLKDKGPAAFALRRLELSLYRRAARTIILWPRADAYIRALGIPAKKVVWISNGIDLKETPAPMPDNDVFTLMYFGAHGGANGLDNVIQAMQRLALRPRAPAVRLRLIGDGPRKEALRRLAVESNVSNVTFEDPVPKKEIPALAAQADAFIFNLIDAPMFQYGISPNKLFDFMAAQRPVIFCCRASNNPVADCGGGITVAPEQPDKLAAAIAELAALPCERRETMGLAGRRHVEEHYGYDRLAQKLARTLDHCLTETCG